MTCVIEVACLGSLWVTGGACAPLIGRRMVSTDTDLVSIVVLFHRLARRAELPSHVHFEWERDRGARLVVKDAQSL